MNDVIAALERAVWLPHDDADAATIRTHIADLQAGRLVRREDVAPMAHLRRDCATGEVFVCRPNQMPTGRPSGSVALSADEIEAAIAAGAHGGGDE